MTRRETHHYAAPLDSVGTIERTQPSRFGMKDLIILIGLGLLSSAFNPSHSYAYSPSVQQIDNYKLYAHNKLYSSHEYECYVQLINRESHWNPRAHNGTHYGMVQGNSKWLLTVDAYQQIDWSINYIHHRYITVCKALHHSLKLNWY